MRFPSRSSFLCVTEWLASLLEDKEFLNFNSPRGTSHLAFLWFTGLASSFTPVVLTYIACVNKSQQQ
jgi:hypothetical protein